MGLYKDRSLELTVLVFIYFLQGRKQMGYQWVYLCLIQGAVCTWACTLSPAWERAMREEVPKDTWRRVPHHAVQCKGNPNQNRTTSETDGLNQDFWKLPVCKNPQETNRFAGYVKNPSYIACKWSPVQSNTWWKYGDKGAM